MNGLRLSAATVVCLKNFCDTANAFLSISHDAALSPYTGVLDPFPRGAPAGHVEQNVFQTETLDSSQFFRASTGVFPGSSAGAPQCFQLARGCHKDPGFVNVWFQDAVIIYFAVLRWTARYAIRQSLYSRTTAVRA